MVYSDHWYALKFGLGKTPNDLNYDFHISQDNSLHLFTK